MLKFIIDTQLPPSLSGYLSSKNCDSRHTTYYPDGHLLKDREIVQMAIDERRIIVTKDHDFLDYYLLKGAPPRVLLLEVGNITNKALFELFEANWIKLFDMLNKEAELVLFSPDRIAEYKL